MSGWQHCRNTMRMCQLEAYVEFFQKKVCKWRLAVSPFLIPVLTRIFPMHHFHSFTLLKITQKFGSWFLSYQKNLLLDHWIFFPPMRSGFHGEGGDQAVACMGRDIIHAYWLWIPIYVHHLYKLLPWLTQASRQAEASVGSLDGAFLEMGSWIASRGSNPNYCPIWLEFLTLSWKGFE